jgi:hypothetical protein
LGGYDGNGKIVTATILILDKGKEITVEIILKSTGLFMLCHQLRIMGITP